MMQKGGGRAGARLRIAQIAAVAATVVVADQLTKFLVARAFRLGDSITLVDGFLWLTHVRNPGVAFGLLSDLAWRWRAPFFAATAAAAAWLFWRIYREVGASLYARLAMGMIMGGAVGNFIDRFRFRGEVVDFIEMGVGNLRWPTYNAADSCISVGTCLLLFIMWREKKL
jgi:signal peptidase II